MREAGPAPHMSSMEPFRIITDPEDLTELRLGSIVCPPRQPGLAYRKAWPGRGGNPDLYTTFESTREADAREVWAVLTMHCPADAPEAWVLWDAGAVKADLPKQGAFVSVVPSRSPRRKAHLTLGYARSAITRRFIRGTASEDMSILQLDPASCQYVTVHDIPAGTPKDQLPW